MVALAWGASGSGEAFTPPQSIALAVSRTSTAGLSLSNGLAGARDDLLLRMAVRVAASESALLRRAALLEGPLAAPVALLCAKQSKSGAEAAQAIASWGRAAIRRTDSTGGGFPCAGQLPLEANGLVRHGELLAS